MKHITTVLPFALITCSHAFATLIPTGGGDAEVNGVLTVEEYGSSTGEGVEQTYLESVTDTGIWPSAFSQTRWMNTEDVAVWEWGYHDGSYFVPQMTLNPDGDVEFGGSIVLGSSITAGVSNDNQGSWSILLGTFSEISSTAGMSLSLGLFNEINGGASLAIGDTIRMDSIAYTYGLGSCIEFGEAALFSFSCGHYTVVEGELASAFGYYTTASTYGGMAIGQYNEAVTKGGNTPDPDDWQGEGADPGPVFEVGIGTGSSDLQNAMTIFQDGTIIIGKVQGDISMGAFGN
ncbi:hypothetical protein [Cerasicoccus frondis]|uniref:hypothetical protein n=1 Tax=Cerasicoccus frondis TaxID=490090 RepID=UPI0028528508|nr:hypothetical protein [Cerasicoccus frondis]